MGRRRMSLIFSRLCSVQTLKLPCINSFPRSDKLPWKHNKNENIPISYHYFFRPKNFVCFLHLLHIFKCTSIRLDLFMEANDMNPIRLLQGSNLISVHIICNIGYLRTCVDKNSQTQTVILCKWTEIKIEKIWRQMHEHAAPLWRHCTRPGASVSRVCLLELKFEVVLELMAIFYKKQYSIILWTYYEVLMLFWCVMYSN